MAIDLSPVPINYIASQINQPLIGEIVTEEINFKTQPIDRVEGEESCLDTISNQLIGG